MSWDFPSVEPPPYLRRLSPALYREECERARARFTEAVQLAEQAFVEELAALVEHLNERLTGEDGRARVFRDSAVTNFDEFFDRFRRLSIGSSGELDELVTRARQVLSGVAPQQLRDSQPLRERITAAAGRGPHVAGRAADGPSPPCHSAACAVIGVHSNVTTERRCQDGPGGRTERHGPLHLRRGDFPDHVGSRHHPPGLPCGALCGRGLDGGPGTGAGTHPGPLHS